MDLQSNSGPTPTRPPRRERADARITARRVMIGVGAVVTGCLLLALSAASALVRPGRPVSLVAVGANYATNLTVPHNACGWNGLVSACGQLPGGDRSQPAGGRLLRGAAAPLLAGPDFKWRDAAARMSDETAVLLVSMHGAADDKGPLLFLQDADPAAGQGRFLRVDALLKELANLPADRRKLVIFDATVAPAYPEFGLLSNRFTDQLAALNDSIESVPNLVVVSASSVGQRSWTEPGAGQTILLHSLVEALRGAAPDRDQNGRISGEELLLHLESEVEVRASRLHQRPQSVLVLPRGSATGRLQRMELALANPSYRAAPTPPAPPPLEPIAGRWSKRGELASRLRQPETVCPILWRRHRLTLVRYEQLLAAGAPALATDAASQLDRLQSQLALMAHRLSHQSDPVQLAGVEPSGAPDDRAEQVHAQLWASPPATARSVWLSATESLGPSQIESLQRRVDDLVLEQFSASPVSRLEQAAAIIKAIGPPSGLRPAETHLVVMLAEGLPTGLDAARWDGPLRLAVQTRRDAERAALNDSIPDQILGAEFLPWLEPRLAEADRLRRQGEDLLFCGVDYLNQAQELLQQADGRFLTIMQQAGTLRAAQRARDRAFCQLPCYTTAADGLAPTSANEATAMARFASDTAGAWQAAHRLADLLASMLGNADRQPTLTDVAAATQQTEAGLQGLRSSTHALVADLMQSSGAAFWNNRDAALAAPGIDVSERLRLLERPAPVPATPSTVDRGVELAVNQPARWRQDTAGRRLLLSLARYGETLFNEVTQQGRGFRDAKRRLEGPQDSAADSEETVAHLTRLEANLGHVCQAIAAAHARASSNLDQGGLREATPARLGEAADAELRYASGAGIHDVDDLLQRIARERWIRSLLARARRVIADGWNSERELTESYARVAAEAYLERVDRLTPGRTDAAALSQLAATPTALELQSPEVIHVVSEVSAPLRCSVESSVPIGAVAVSATTGSGLRVTSPADGRQALLLGDEEQSLPQVVVAPDADDKDDSAPIVTRRLTLQGWLRGHLTSKQIDVNLYRQPTIQASSPPAPQQAGVAFVALDGAVDGLGSSGGVAFVLDASGSMGPVDDSSPGKYQRAVDELVALLADLPRGIQTSVWVFGQAVGAQKTVEQPESTIRRVLAPVRWDPDDQALLRRLSSELAYPRVEPWNESPLGRCLLSAAGDLRSVAGSKSIVAITDGLDNRFADDTTVNPGKASLGDVLSSELAGKGIALNVIGFQLTPAEQAAVRQQFAFLPSLTPPGRWWEAGQDDSLQSALRSALGGARRVHLAPSGAHADAAPEGHWAPVATHASQWRATSVPPGEYHLGDSAGVAPSLELHAGDLMVLALRRQGTGLSAAPLPLAACRATAAPTVGSGPWRLSILHHRQLPDTSTSLMVALEREASGDGPAATLRQTRPELVWFEYGNDSASTQAWAPSYGYPAPCWEVRSTRVTGAPAPFEVWWSGAEPPTASATLRRGHEFSALRDLEGGAWNLNGVRVSIERVAVRPRVAADSTGRRTEQPTLEIELASEQPCLVRLRGLVPSGSQLQAYREAGRCVARFWPITDGQLAASLRGIELTTLADFKQHAEAGQRHAVFRELPPASPDAPWPLPTAGWVGAARD